MSALPRVRTLASSLAAILTLASPDARSALQTVTNCSDSGPGSLRSAIASAASGDMVVFDTAQMNCSTITLTSGQIFINALDITLQGPGSGALTISGNYTSRIFVDKGSTFDYSRKLTINDLTIANGKALGSYLHYSVAGGCIVSTGLVTLSGSIVTGCLAQNTAGSAAGGAIWSTSLHMQGSTISNSRVSGLQYASDGAGAFVRGEVVLEFSTLTGNVAQSSPFLVSSAGGGLASSGSATGDVLIAASTISNNAATFGGGLHLSYGMSGRSVMIDHSAIFGNLASNISGGALIENSGTTVIVDSTISGNQSRKYNGGILKKGAMLTVSNSTIAFNHAALETTASYFRFAAGLYASAATLQSSIIANNTVGASTESDLNGPAGASMLGSNNLIMATLAGTTAPAGTLTSDPLLGTLADNGGPTMTHALLGGSPAIGAGNNLAGLTSDQRGPGFARTTAGMTDIGAFQTGDGIFSDGFESL